MPGVQKRGYAGTIHCRVWREESLAKTDTTTCLSGCFSDDELKLMILERKDVSDCTNKIEDELIERRKKKFKASKNPLFNITDGDLE